MSSFLKTTRETKLAGAIGGILSRPAATIAMAAGLSVLTLAASLYLFMFAGRDLLPPPPIARLPAAHILMPVPMNPSSALVPEMEVPAAPDLVEFLVSSFPAIEAAAVQSDSGAASAVAGASLAPSPEDDDDDHKKNDRSGNQSDGSKKSKKDKDGSDDVSKPSRHED